jgi:hypothetical protein
MDGSQPSPRSLVGSAEASLCRAVYADARSRAWDMAPASCERVEVSFAAREGDAGWTVEARVDFRARDCNDGGFRTVLSDLSEADAERLSKVLNGIGAERAKLARAA